jgi:hypothetical protein
MSESPSKEIHSESPISDTTSIDDKREITDPDLERANAAELSEAAKKALKEFTSRLSKRSKGALVRHSFVRSDNGTKTPLSRLSSSKGRGAEVAIKLYLGLLWLSSRPPYDSNFPARSWAALLNLKDPETKGTRRVSVALKKLEELDLIRIEQRSGKPNHVVILKEDGSGDPYKIPSGKTTSKDDYYFNVPVRLWTEGYIQQLSAAAITMLLIIMEEYQRSNYKPQWWSMKTFNSRFGISKDVRAKGTKELLEQGLILVSREGIPTISGSVLAQRRSRKTYRPVSAAANSRKHKNSETFGNLLKMLNRK